MNERERGAKWREGDRASGRAGEYTPDPVGRESRRAEILAPPGQGAGSGVEYPILLPVPRSLTAPRPRGSFTLVERATP